MWAYEIVAITRAQLCERQATVLDLFVFENTNYGIIGRLFTYCKNKNKTQCKKIKDRFI